MAQVYTFDTGAAVGRPGWLERARKGLDDYRLYRRTIDELQALSDRELADLGLSRLNIRDIAYDSVYGA